MDNNSGDRGTTRRTPPPPLLLSDEELQVRDSNHSDAQSPISPVEGGGRVQPTRSSILHKASRLLNMIPSEDVITKYGAYRKPSEEEALKYHEKEHAHHKEFDLIRTRPWELKAFGQGCMLYFYFLRYMAIIFGMMAILCGFPNMILFLCGNWYNNGASTLEITTIGNYGLVSNSTLGAGNLTILLQANPVLASDPAYNISSGNNFGASGSGASAAIQRELATLALFRADGNMTPSTIAGHNKRTTINAMAILDLITCVFYFAFSLFFIVQTRRLSLKCDLGNCTIEDYSLRVCDVPLDVTKEELHEHFGQFGAIYEIVRAHEVWELVYLARKRQQCFEKHEYALAALQKAASEGPRVPEFLETEVLESGYDLAVIKQAMKLKRQERKNAEIHNTIEAYVVFEHIDSKERALNSYPAKSAIIKGLKRIFGIGLLNNKRNLRNGTWPIEVTEAPEPSDMIWENLHIKKSRVYYITISWLLKALLLLAGFLATSLAPALKYSLSKWKGGPPVSDCNSYCTYSDVGGQPQLNTTLATFYETCYNTKNLTYCGSQTICYECFCRLTIGSGDYAQADYCSPFLSILAVYTAATALSVLAIVVVNYVLPYAMIFLSTLEKHHTLSAMHKSTAQALIFMFFLNTAVSIMVANAYLPNIRRVLKGTPAGDYLLLGVYPDLTPGWFRTVGNSLLIAQWIGIFSRMFIIIFDYIYQWYFLLPFVKKSYITQRQLNKAYDGSNFTLDEKYGMHTGVIFITLFLGGTLPLSYAISCISFMTIYWLEKHFLLKFCKRPVPYSNMLSCLISEIMPWAALWHLAFAAWSFSMIAVPESPLMNRPMRWVLGAICRGLTPVWNNTNGLSAEDMTTRLAQTNSFPLVLFLFILVLSYAAFSFVDHFNWFFGPLFFRIVRKIKQFVIIRFVHKAVNDHVVKHVNNAAGMINQTVKKMGDTAISFTEKRMLQSRGGNNQIAPETSEASRVRLRKEKEKQRDLDEAILNAAVNAAIKAQEEVDEMKFEALLERSKKSQSESELGGRGQGLEEDIESRAHSASKTMSEAKLHLASSALPTMPLFSEAVAAAENADSGYHGWRLEGPSSYRIEKSPLYSEIFDESMDYLKYEEEAAHIQQQLQGRSVAISRARRLMRSKVDAITVSTLSPQKASFRSSLLSSMFGTRRKDSLTLISSFRASDLASEAPSPTSQQISLPEVRSSSLPSIHNKPRRVAVPETQTVLEEESS